MKAKPPMWPTGWPSTTTSPRRVTADSRLCASPASSRRISMRGAAVDEAGGQPLVQGVRQQVLDLARPALPVRGVRTQSARAAM